MTCYTDAELDHAALNRTVVGEQGWLVRNLRDDKGNVRRDGDNVAQERLSGVVALVSDVR